MIIARGKKNGRRIMVTYNKDQFLFDGEDNLEYEAQIVYELLKFHAIGGTYYPEKESDPLNVINVLREYFFDDNNVLITSEEKYEIPYEEGVVY